jgi:hypothetical protein
MARDKGEGKPSLRARAEKLLGGESKALDEFSPQELASLFHELQVHQIELKMQNEELHSAQEQLERSRRRTSRLAIFSAFRGAVFSVRTYASSWSAPPGSPLRSI